jgi:hypothetical protein
VITSHLTEHPSQQAVVEAALLMLRQMGLSPDDLVTAPRDRPQVPTFAEYIPVVSAAVTAGTRRAYGSYWNRVLEHWGERRLDEIAPSEIRQLMSYVKAHVVARRNARGGRSATEHLVAALRCLYRHAEDDGLITQSENPARKVDKPRRLPSTRRAVTDDRLAEICQAAADGGDDPELDTLLLRLHTETACFSRGQFGHSGIRLMFPQFSSRSAAASGATRVVHVRCWMSQPHRMAWLSWAMSSRLAERAAVRSWSRSSSWSRRSMTCC